MKNALAATFPKIATIFVTTKLAMPKIPFWIFILLAMLYLSAARVDVMDVDAAQYAEMSREMSISNDYLHLYNRGYDYLDKPPMLFWLSATSMKVFGINNFAYKLPSILFALLALYATYRLAKLLYDEQTGRLAALVLGCSQGLFLMANDVRTDTLLMSWVILAIWLIKEWEVEKKLPYLLLGCAAIAGGMMTKGPVALLVPVFCFATDWVLKREWKNFLRREYLLGLLVIALLLVPMCIGLYQQYDLHPEKIIDGKPGTSGIRFFFWTQSFGRITGENTWDNGAPFGFLMENMLWEFLPWILLFLLSLALNSIQLARQKFRIFSNQEWLTTGGFIITYISLASSHYQLPHYIFVVFPLASIMVAALIKQFAEGRYKQVYAAMQPTQTVISALLLIAALATFSFIFKEYNWAIIWMAGVVLWVWLLIKKNISGKMVWLSASAIIIANVFMTNHFYYTLMKFQAGSQVGRFIRKGNIAAKDIAIYKPEDPLDALHFYAQRVIEEDTLTPPGYHPYILTMKKGLHDLDSMNISYTIASQGSYYKVSELTPEFINPTTRREALKPYYLIKLK